MESTDNLMILTLQRQLMKNGSVLTSQLYISFPKRLLSSLQGTLCLLTILIL